MAMLTAGRKIIDLGYRPRPQFVPFHKREQRWAAIVAHRRCGKTVACIMDLIDAALRSTKQSPRFAYIGPYYSQTKAVAWDYMKQFTHVIPGVAINESELRVDFPNGARVRLFGAENFNALRGLYLDGVVLDEYADMDPRVWPEVIRPALSDRKGWAVFIGTPKGRNGFYDIWAGNAETGWPGATESGDWFDLMLRASETGIIDDDELRDARQTMTPEQFAQEYECSFDAAIIGSYYGRDLSDLESQQRITNVPWERQLSVDTSWDLGIDDATAVWFFQTVGNEIRVIDHYEVNDQDLVSTAKVLLGKPYAYGTHYLPHDIAIRELISGSSRQEALEGVGIRPINVGTRADPAERINAVRMILPRCIFDAQKCKRGLEALKNYRRDWDDKRKTFRTQPCHDWSSHSADAFGEFAVNYRTKVHNATIAYPKRAYA